MPALTNYHIFISHAWRYGREYTRLIQLLNNTPNFSYQNFSAPREKPLHNLDASDVQTTIEIQRAITRKIYPCSCVLVISGMYAMYSRWMQYEIDTARRLGKPIIAIRPYGGTRMPSAVTEAASVTVGWHTDSIVSAVRAYH